MGSPSTMAPLPHLDNPVHQAYFSELLSFTLDRLHKEPDLLRIEANRIKREMQEVAVGNYKGFIRAAEAVQSISQEIGAVDRHLEDLVEEVPKLSRGCNDFMEQGRQLLENQKLNRTLLSNHDTILDLLEIPQLMDTCVRNGNYDEALDLEVYVNKLATMHPDLPVIQSLAEEVKKTTMSLLQQILQRLKSNVQLPESLRLVGYLRRLNVYSENELRLQFLRCREAFVSSIVDELEPSNPYEYLKRVAECHKVHLFDAVTHYRSIFADETSEDFDEEEDGDGGLLYSWTMHRISTHLGMLEDRLPRITEGASLSVVLDQTMFCGMSLGRVGLDFRGLLPPLFERAVHQLFVRNMSIAMANFQHVLDTHKWVPLPSVGPGVRGDAGPDDLVPPYSLMDHYPLAVFVNGFLAALNELRHCAPLNLKDALTLEVKQVLQGVADAILRYNATHMLRESESNLFLSLCRAFIDVAGPYTLLCFGRVYSGGASSIKFQDIVEGVRRLVVTTPYQLPKDNGNKKSLQEAKNKSALKLYRENSSAPVTDGPLTDGVTAGDGEVQAVENGHKEEPNDSESAQSDSQESSISRLASDETTEPVVAQDS